MLYLLVALVLEGVALGVWFWYSQRHPPVQFLFQRDGTWSVHDSDGCTLVLGRTTEVTYVRPTATPPGTQHGVRVLTLHR